MATQRADTFTRANNASSWGTASDGNTWTTKAGTGTESITSNKGQLTQVGSSYFNTLGASLSTADGNGLVRVVFNGSTGDTGGILLRFTDTNNYYLGRYDGVGHMAISKKVAGTSTTLDNSTSFTPTLGTAYWIRFQVQGTTLSIKHWTDGSSEPASWDKQVTDSSLAGTGGSANLVGINGFAQTTNTVQFDQFSVDDLSSGLTQSAAATIALKVVGATVSAGATVATVASHTLQAGATLAITATPYGPLLGNDTFGGRTVVNTNTFGTASDGVDTWTTQTGGIAQTIGGKGQVFNSSVLEQSTFGNILVQDSDQLIRFRLSTANTTTADTFIMMSRWTDGAHYYAARYNASPSGGQGGFGLYFRIGGALSLINAQLSGDSTTVPAGVDFWLRFRTIGTSPTHLQLKWWQDGANEPGGWQIDLTDNSALLQISTGNVGVSAFGVSGTGVQFDNYTVRKPYTATAPVAAGATLGIVNRVAVQAGATLDIALRSSVAAGAQVAVKLAAGTASAGATLATAGGTTNSVPAGASLALRLVAATAVAGATLDIALRASAQTGTTIAVKLAGIAAQAGAKLAIGTGTTSNSTNASATVAVVHGTTWASLNGIPSYRPSRDTAPNPDGWWATDSTGEYQGLDPTTFMQAEMAQIGALHPLLLRLEVPWAAIEPNAPSPSHVYNWTRMDAVLAAARANNVSLWPVLVFSPAWASSNPGSFGGLNSPNGTADYAAFCTAFATRYPTIQFIEIWNEPDGGAYWAGTAAQYGQLLAAAGAAIHAVGNGQKVIFGGLSQGSGSTYDTFVSSALGQTGAVAAVDIMSFHAYDAFSASSLSADATHVRSVVTSAGVASTVPIWCGEYSVQGDATDTQDSTRAGYISGVYALSNANLQLASYYTFRDDLSMDDPTTIAAFGYRGVIQINYNHKPLSFNAFLNSTGFTGVRTYAIQGAATLALVGRVAVQAAATMATFSPTVTTVAIQTGAGLALKYVNTARAAATISLYNTGGSGNTNAIYFKGVGLNFPGGGINTPGGTETQIPRKAEIPGLINLAKSVHHIWWVRHQFSWYFMSPSYPTQNASLVDWSLSDAIANACVANNVGFVASLGAMGYSGSTPIAPSAAYWTWFVQQFTARYHKGGTIPVPALVIEPWNEPELNWNGQSMSSFLTQIQLPAYNAVKSVDANVPVHLATVDYASGFGAAAWQSFVTAAAGQKFVDLPGFHDYANSTGTWTSQFKSFLAANGISYIAIFQSEFGAGITPPVPNPDTAHQSVINGMLPQVLAGNSSYPDTTIYYAMTDLLEGGNTQPVQSYGLYQAGTTSSSPGPAYASETTFQNLMAGVGAFPVGGGGAVTNATPAPVTLALFTLSHTIQAGATLATFSPTHSVQAAATLATTGSGVPQLPTFLQETGISQSGSAQFPGNCTPGSTLVAVFGGGSVPSSVSDNVNGAWGAAVVSGTSGHGPISVFVKYNAAGNTRITVTGTGQSIMAVGEYTNIAAASPFEAGQAGGFSNSTATCTTTSVNDLLVGAFFHTTFQTWTMAASDPTFTQRALGGTNFAAMLAVGDVLGVPAGSHSFVGYDTTYGAEAIVALKTTLPPTTVQIGATLSGSAPLGAVVSGWTISATLAGRGGLALVLGSASVVASLAAIGTMSAVAVTTSLSLGSGVQSINYPIIRVQGNHFIDGHGNVTLLHGANVSGAEYAPVQGKGIFDTGTTNLDGHLVTWGANVVRLPLNEDAWLGINTDPTNSLAPHTLPAMWAGANYQNAVYAEVQKYRARGMYVILDLHWNAPDAILAEWQQQMADVSHGPAFWTSVASMFKNDLGVIFDLYNEPFVGTWAQWLSGGPATTYKNANAQDVTYAWQTAGMQQLLNAVRGTGAQNVCLAAGIAWADDVSQWAANAPVDPINQLAASWHAYHMQPFTGTGNVFDPTAATGVLALAAQYPIIVTETGDDYAAYPPVNNDFSGQDFISTLLPWLDAAGISWLGWAYEPNWGKQENQMADDPNGTYTGVPYGPLGEYGNYIYNRMRTWRRPHPMPRWTQDPAGNPAVPTYASSASIPASAALQDGTNFPWRSNGTPTTGAPQWIAIDMSGVPLAARQHIVFHWEEYGTTDYDNAVLGGAGYNQPRDYTIQVHTAAGGGQPPADGDSGWVIKTTVTGDQVNNRSFALDLTAATYNWIRMRFTAINGSPSNMDVSCHINIHDDSQSGGSFGDGIILFGDSITANDYQGYDNDSVPKQVHSAITAVFPDEVRAGIGYLTTADGATWVPHWLSTQWPGPFAMLAYGTNDANTGSQLTTAQLNTIKTNIQSMVNSCLAAGVVPIIPHIPSSPAAGFNVNGPLVDQVIDQVIAAEPRALAGPDFWTLLGPQNASLFQDGLHPNTAGQAIMRAGLTQMLVNGPYHPLLDISALAANSYTFFCGGRISGATVSVGTVSGVSVSALIQASAAGMTAFLPGTVALAPTLTARASLAATLTGTSQINLAATVVAGGSLAAQVPSTLVPVVWYVQAFAKFSVTLLFSAPLTPTLAGSATLGATLFITTVVATFPAGGSLALAGSITLVPITATLAGVGSMGAGFILAGIVNVGATISAAGGMDATFSLVGTIGVGVTVTGMGSIGVGFTIAGTLSLSAAMAARGGIAAGVVPSFTIGGTLAGAGSFLGAITAQTAAQFTLSAAGSLSCTLSFAILLAAAPVGSGGMTVTVGTFLVLPAIAILAMGTFIAGVFIPLPNVQIFPPRGATQFWPNIQGSTQ